MENNGRGELVQGTDVYSICGIITMKSLFMYYNPNIKLFKNKRGARCCGLCL
jgi:hypothetical protein